MGSYECQAAAAGAQRCAFNARRSALLWRTSPHSLFTASSGYDNPEALGWPACPNPDSDHALPQRPLVSDPQRRAVARRGEASSASASRVAAPRAVGRWTSMDWRSPDFPRTDGRRERNLCMFKFPAPTTLASGRACWMWVRVWKCVLGACVCAPAAAAAAAALDTGSLAP